MACPGKRRLKNWAPAAATEAKQLNISPLAVPAYTTTSGTRAIARSTALPSLI
eukprot:CAMPEP_0203841696 /NCGR_PEP_ID=MMETSP0359-20131031/1552_1 /ASSEMBLY_ACC=CAM_ASM_000338 /TAXON_ID=268821 /ORGANISM="Scrippsiella Hangoei, Strain SHTV-5" /LENGTH=52 /DNA_ID=CAMNT_0050756167 /DNA_START=118 /DNA_END=273 /DNA_ORIENTATION=-